MILRIEDLKDVCNKILSAVDSSELSLLTETLELKTNNNILYMSVTNREYYVRVKLDLGEIIKFHATVNANLFLKLISQTTTETVEIIVDNNTMIVKGNGVYKLPLIYDDTKLLELPVIEINNIVSQFDIEGDILVSILNYNSKEIAKGNIVRPVQKLYYIDEEGAITFTTGACVNNFKLEKPIKILLNQKVVKLFKLFKNDNVHFTLGMDSISEEIIQTKVRFENDVVSITAILPNDDGLLASVPVSAIRNRISTVYPYSVNINRDEFIQAINRLLLFINSKEFIRTFGNFEFKNEYIILKDSNNINNEKLYYSAPLENCDYSNSIDLLDLKATLENCAEKYLTMNFGDGQAVVIARGNVYNVIPEVVRNEDFI